MSYILFVLPCLSLSAITAMSGYLTKEKNYLLLDLVTETALKDVTYYI